MFDVDSEEEQKPGFDIDDVLAQLGMGKAKAKAAAGAIPSPNPAPSPGADTTAPPASPGASTSPAATPAQPDWTQAFKAGADRNAADASSITSTLKPATPPPPANPDMGTLLAQKAAESMPVNPKAVDPATGKPKYRMGIGGRIAGSLANFASGMAGRGPVVYVGPGAVNNQYRIDEDMRQKRLAAISQQLADQQALQEENRRQYDTYTQAQDRAAQVKEREAKAQKYENAIDPNSLHQKDDGTWVGTTYGGETKETDAPRWYTQMENKKDKPSQEEQRIAYQNAVAKMEKGGEKTFPDNVKGQILAIRRSKLLSPDEKSQAIGYLAANPVPGDKVINIRTGGGKEDEMTAGQMRMIEARAPGLRAQLAEAQRELAKWNAINPESHQAKNAQAAVDNIHKVLDPVIQDVITHGGKQAKPNPATGNVAPAMRQPAATSQTKTISKAKIQAMALKGKVPYQKVEKQFKDANYTITGN